MKYQPPAQGAYESGLTAEALYKTIGGLLKAHFTPDEIEASRAKPAIERANLWRKAEIRSELEEFVKTYFFGNLELPLPGFEEMLPASLGEIIMPTETAVESGPRILKNSKEKLDGYIDQLGLYYSSRDAACEAISKELGKIVGYKDRLYEETKRVKSLERDELIKENTNEAFGQMSNIYGWIELIVVRSGIRF